MFNIILAHVWSTETGSVKTNNERVTSLKSTDSGKDHQWAVGRCQCKDYLPILQQEWSLYKEAILRVVTFTKGPVNITTGPQHPEGMQCEALYITHELLHPKMFT
jgi:hypothetical protein